MRNNKQRRLTRRQFVKFSGVTAAAVALGGLAACAPSPAASPAPPAPTAQQPAPSAPTVAPAAKAKVDVVRIAFPIELSGPTALFGQAFHNAAKLAVDDINAAGGIQSLGGAKLELLVQDTRSDLQQALDLIDKLADQKDVVAAIGPIASATVVTSSLKYEQLKVPYLVPSVDDVITERGLKYIFRVVARMSKYATGAAQFAKDIEAKTGVKHKRLGIVAMDVEPGTSAVKTYEAFAKAEGWDFVTETYPMATTKDFSPLITRLRSAGVDLVVGFQYPNDGILFAQAAKELDFNPIGYVWAIGAQFLNSFQKQVGLAAEYLFDNSYMAADFNDEAVRLDKLYQAQYGEALTGLSGTSPSIVATIKDALERAGSTDREAVRDALTKTDIAATAKWWTTPGGCQFDAKGDNVRADGALIQIVGGQQYLVYPAAQAKRQPVWPRPKWAEIK